MQEQTIPFRDYYQRNRNQIVLSYDQAKEIALRNFDEMASKLAEQFELVETIKKEAIDASKQTETEPTP